MATATIHTDNMVCPECNRHIIREDYYAEGGMCRQCYRTWYAKCRDCDEVFRRADPEPGREYDRIAYYHQPGNLYCPECRAHPFNRMIGDECEGFYDWNTYFEIAENSEGVNFGCNFDCKGKCSGTRGKVDVEWYGKTKRACCNACVEEKGYLKVVPSEAIETLEEVWNEEDGFWSSEGCKLPIKYRSHTCNGFVCDKAKKSRHFDRKSYWDYRVAHDQAITSAKLERCEQDLQSGDPEKIKWATMRLESHSLTQSQTAGHKLRREQSAIRRKALQAAEVAMYGELGYVDEVEDTAYWLALSEVQSMERLLYWEEAGRPDPMTLVTIS